MCDTPHSAHKTIMSNNNTKKTTTPNPTRINVDLVGICSGDRGRSCDEHSVCASAVTMGMVLKLKVVIIITDNKKEEAAIAAYRIGEDGVKDLCRVGFLPRFAAKRPKQFAGKRVKVVDIFSEDDDSPVRRAWYHKNRGFAIAEIIEEEQPESEPKHEISDSSKAVESVVVQIIDDKQAESEPKRKISDCNDSSSTKKQKNDETLENE